MDRLSYSQREILQRLSHEEAGLLFPPPESVRTSVDRLLEQGLAAQIDGRLIITHEGSQAVASNAERVTEAMNPLEN